MYEEKHRRMEKFFKTRSLPVAAFLVATDYDLLKTEKADGGIEFVFRGSAERTADRYWKFGYVVARDYFDAIRYLRDIIHKERNK